MALLNKVLKSKRKHFMQAVAASCATVAFADGIVRPEETDKLMEFIRLEKNLKSFDYYEVLEEFERYIEFFEFEFNVGKEKALKAIRKIEKRSEEAKLIVYLCIAIAKSNEYVDHIDNNQILIIRDIAKELGFDPREFNLNLRAPSLSDLSSKDIKRITKPAHIPDWMRDTSKITSRPQKRPGTQKAPAKPSDKNIPDWMKNPPALPKSSPQKDDSSMPGWMKNPSKIMKQHEKDKETIPDWMKNPPALPKSSSKKDDSSVPGWMKNPSGIMKQHEKDKETIPDWMKNPPRLSDSSSDRDKSSMPEWMKDPSKLMK